MKRLLLSCIAVALPLAATASCKGCNQDSSTSASDAAADGGSDASSASTFDAAAVRAFLDGDAGATVPWAAMPGATAALLPNMGIPERFEIEKKSRPANIKPNVESAVAALRKAGFNIVREKQHLGQPFGARYCVGAEAVTDADASSTRMFFLSLCEFVSPEVAELSTKYNASISKGIADRVVKANKQMTLTTRLEGKTPENQAASDKAFTTFSAL